MLLDCLLSFDPRILLVALLGSFETASTMSNELDLDSDDSCFGSVLMYEPILRSSLVEFCYILDESGM